jgi:hypothetical protein
MKYFYFSDSLCIRFSYKIKTKVLPPTRGPVLWKQYEPLDSHIVIKMEALNISKTSTILPTFIWCNDPKTRTTLEPGLRKNKKLTNGKNLTYQLSFNPQHNSLHFRQIKVKLSICLNNRPAMNTCGNWRYILMYFYPLRRMELHAQAAIPRRATCKHLSGWVGPKGSLDTVQEKSSLLLPLIEPLFLSRPACSLLTIQIETSRPHGVIYSWIVLCCTVWRMLGIKIILGGRLDR